MLTNKQKIEYGKKAYIQAHHWATFMKFDKFKSDVIADYCEVTARGIASLTEKAVIKEVLKKIDGMELPLEMRYHKHIPTEWHKGYNESLTKLSMGLKSKIKNGGVGG